MHEGQDDKHDNGRQHNGERRWPLPRLLVDKRERR
jgi:hypothetical protein